MKEKTKFLKGFTLVEISVSALISSLIIGGIFAVLNVADISWDSDMGLVDLQQQARQAMDGMIREIRQSGPSYNIQISDKGKKITFKVIYISNPISYYLSNKQIIREHPQGTTKILANDMGSLSFCCYQDSTCSSNCSNSLMLRIELGATKKTVRQRLLSFNLIEKVKLRNE